MHNHLKTLQNIVTRKRTSRILTFSTPHVFKALHVMHGQKYTSRQAFCKELRIGEGAVRTLILHLKQERLADSIRAGTFLTTKGMRFVKKILDVVPYQCSIVQCDIAQERYNHAILLRDYASSVSNGMEQRDYSIMYGAKGATTLSFENGKFVFPGDVRDCLKDDSQTKKVLMENLRPEENDLVIIASSDDDPFVAEISAINSVLWTLATHERH
ncbi:MAG: DUF4443 domain-containing protein [Nitrosopumilus sp.]|nr:MAG: DUF4443 domain-containing protein [Nitrosopumilus sp.]